MSFEDVRGKTHICNTSQDNSKAELIPKAILKPDTKLQLFPEDEFEFQLPVDFAEYTHVILAPRKPLAQKGFNLPVCQLVRKGR